MEGCLELTAEEKALLKPRRRLFDDLKFLNPCIFAIKAHIQVRNGQVRNGQGRNGQLINGQIGNVLVRGGHLRNGRVISFSGQFHLFGADIGRLSGGVDSLRGRHCGRQ